MTCEMFASPCVTAEISPTEVTDITRLCPPFFQADEYPFGTRAWLTHGVIHGVSTRNMYEHQIDVE